MKNLDKGFSWNFQNQKTEISLNPTNAHVNVPEMLIRPERYVHYFAKLGMYLDQKHVGGMRYPVCGVFYAYTRLMCGMKRLIHRAAVYTNKTKKQYIA